MHVVVTDCHRRGVFSIIRELASCGHEVTAVCEKGLPPLGLHCRFAACKVLLPRNLSENEYSEALLDLCGKHGDSVLLPFGQRTVRAVSNRRDAFGTVARFLVPSPSVLETAGDKLLTERLADSLGIPTPERFRFQSADPAEKLASRLSYPVVLKYRNGEKLGLSVSRHYTIATEPREFIKRYETMHDVQPPVIVQEYVPGKSLGVSALMDAEHRPVRVFCHERLREYPVTGGESTACRSGWYPELAATAVSLLAALRFTGFAMVEFRGSPADAKLLGINPRIWGSYPLSVHSGAKMSGAYVDTVYGVPPPKNLSCNYATDVKMQYLISDFRAALGYLGHGQAGVSRRVLADAFSSKVKGGVFSNRDLRGSLYYLANLPRCRVTDN